MTKDEALKLALEALEKLWNIIDDIDTYGDMAKADEKLYRSLVERRQRTRFEETGITTDGYELSGGAITAIKEALAQPEQEPKCGAIIEVFGKDWRLEYLSLPVGKHKLYTQQYTYTTPPQRKPLTDEEIDKAWRSCDYTVPWEQHRIDIARAIEAAHGIKGEA